MCVVGRRVESKPASLTKQNDPKENHSSPANLKYKPRGLTTWIRSCYSGT